MIAILGVLAALLFPVFASSKEMAKGSVCLSNLRQLGLATGLYAADANDRYPQCRKSSGQPETDDADGHLDEPDYGSYFTKILPYAKGSKGLLACGADADPFGAACLAENPDAPDLSSYLVNAGFIFGLTDSAIDAPANTVQMAERRSGGSPFCDYTYHPWFTAAHPSAPEDQMDAKTGAVATARHAGGSTFVFADEHVKRLPWSQTFSPPKVDLHTIRRE